MMRIGVVALLELLAESATPTTAAVAPIVPTTDARKLFDL